MVKVFISSTSIDLKDYRAAAIAMCEEQAIVVEPIAMEYFEAMDIGAVEGSLRKVREAQIYVGILAHRYGFIPPDETRSITEMEFDEATRIGIPRLCFLINEEYPWIRSSLIARITISSRRSSSASTVK